MHRPHLQPSHGLGTKHSRVFRPRRTAAQYRRLRLSLMWSPQPRRSFRSRQSRTRRLCRHLSLSLSLSLVSLVSLTPSPSRQQLPKRLFLMQTSAPHRCQHLRIWAAPLEASTESARSARIFGCRWMSGAAWELQARRLSKPLGCRQQTWRQCVQ